MKTQSSLLEREATWTIAGGPPPRSSAAMGSTPCVSPFTKGIRLALLRLLLTVDSLHQVAKIYDNQTFDNTDPMAA